MKADKININALKFGIMCNFTPFCGEERARESVEFIMELERLAEIGEATEKAFMQEAPELTFEPITKICIRNIEELLEWAEKERNGDDIMWYLMPDSDGRTSIEIIGNIHDEGESDAD